MHILAHAVAMHAVAMHLPHAAAATLAILADEAPQPQPQLQRPGPPPAACWPPPRCLAALPEAAAAPRGSGASPSARASAADSPSGGSCGGGSSSAASSSGARLMVASLARGPLLEALRLQSEARGASLAARCCRVPSLRHTPVRELTRLAKHLRTTHYAPGDVLLAQGKEVSGVHILIAGSVQLVVAARPHMAAVTAAAGGETGRAGPGQLVVLGTRCALLGVLISGCSAAASVNSQPQASVSRKCCCLSMHSL